MPRDLWQKARFRDTARFASREYASGEGQSSFAYAWNDDEAIRGVKQILKLQQRSRQIPSSSPTSPGTQIPLRQRLNMLFVSKKLWSRSGLRPEAISITGIPATISRVGDNAWAWCVELGTSTVSGIASRIEDARVGAMETILMHKPCLRQLAEFVGIELPKELK